MQPLFRRLERFKAIFHDFRKKQKAERRRRGTHARPVPVRA